MGIEILILSKRPILKAWDIMLILFCQDSLNNHLAGADFKKVCDKKHNMGEDCI